MNTKDTLINDKNFQKLLHNDEYYKNIFKKTEKIVSAVFYILQQSDIDTRSETHSSNVASKAHFVHENALRTLEVKPSAAREVLEQFAQALIGLDSTLRVVTAAALITPEVLQAVTAEIDVVLRTLRPYLADESTSVLSLLDATPTRSSSAQPARAARSSALGSAGSARPSSAAAAASGTPSDPAADRRSRIKTVLEAKGDATIKDISEIITDVSEKTIQRDLNAMIDTGDVQRQGERRWSRYSVL